MSSFPLILTLALQHAAAQGVSFDHEETTPTRQVRQAPLITIPSVHRISFWPRSWLPPRDAPLAPGSCPRQASAGPNISNASRTLPV